MNQARKRKRVCNLKGDNNEFCKYCLLGKDGECIEKQADEKKEVWWCEPGDTLTKVLNVLTDAMMLEWVGETLIDRVTQSVLPFWVMPEDILDNMLVYPKDYEGIPNSIV